MTRLTRREVIATEQRRQAAKNYLRSARYYKYRIAEISEELATLNYSLLPGAINYDKPSVISSPTSDSISLLLARIQDKELERKELMQKYFQKVGEIKGQLSVIQNDLYRCILYTYYVLGSSANDVAFKVGYSERHMYRILDEALNEFAELYNPDLVSECQ